MTKRQKLEHKYGNAVRQATMFKSLSFFRKSKELAQRIVARKAPIPRVQVWSGLGR